ncbi:MAG: peptide chain release factor N(5)-glutamine methyltransferase [Deltaproteobacteria bacterium]|nr:peptide chain release factor N(5)-glutamine methyltransferase [Deltaproteobacteria bacterium]
MSPQKWIIRDLLAVTTDYLRKKDIDSPRLCAELLLAHQLKTTRIKLYLDFDQPLNERDINEYRSLIQRRLRREPVQYITGVQEFWSMEFSVGPQVLIPRPETEILVEETLSILKGKINVCETTKASVLDVGTGSGAIAISVAKELPEADVWGCDVSADALEIAMSNARRYGLENRVRFIESDLFSSFDDSQLFDAIVSNPPYIPAEDYGALPPEVGQYEPRTALDGGEQGLFFINKLILEAKAFLKPGGRLLMEMAPFQTAKTMDLIAQTGFYTEQKIIKDYSHKERVVVARKP